VRDRLHRAGILSLAVFTVATVLGVAVDITPGSGATALPGGTLTLNASLRLSSLLGGCQPPAGADDCAARTIEGAFPGLGQVTGRYEFYADVGSPSCAEGSSRVLSYPIRFAVAGKGEIHVAVAEALCRSSSDPVYNQTQTFTVTGGTGIYAGATGSGTLERQLGNVLASGSRVGRESWTGTLVAPSVASFDVVPPTITGAVSKAVRAPRGARRARIVYTVAARDDTDGAVPVACTPRSRTWFPLGRTRVSCTATDSSGNTATARFVLAVRPRR
jgi:hypothetical protein